MLTPKRDTDPGLPCQNTSLLLEIWEPVPPQLPSPVPRNLFLLSYYFQVLKKHMFYLKIQKSCQNKNYTKDASVTFTQIHLLTSYPICSIVCSVFYIWVYVNPSLPEPFEGKLHTSFILHCCVHFPSIRISNNRNSVINFSDFTLAQYSNLFAFQFCQWTQFIFYSVLSPPAQESAWGQAFHLVIMSLYPPLTWNISTVVLCR